MKPIEVTPKVIKKYITEEVITIGELASRVGYSKDSFYSNYYLLKKGRNTMKFRIKIAEYFTNNNITTEDLR